MKALYIKWSDGAWLDIDLDYLPKSDIYEWFMRHGKPILMEIR